MKKITYICDSCKREVDEVVPEITLPISCIPYMNYSWGTKHLVQFETYDLCIDCVQKILKSLDKHYKASSI